ncbi:unnamed protein product [Clavelina lepadiformis]|uniref:Peroxisomal membrane protein PEX13 n=1 Tax=Clavelina lepadiformis TaxID=159417 RepID=A0ABP0FML5_CLALP
MSSSGAPPKPWEINRGQSPGNYSNLRSSAEMEETRTAPPVPTRPSQQQRASSPLYRPGYGGLGYGGYGGTYGIGGYGGMYGGGMYGSSGMYGSPYRNYSSLNNAGSFTQQAEESTRQAFQSVESIVRAFSSVSAMLESTFGAVYSSFRAVLDVADHFSRVKATFTDILSSIAVFRLFRYLYRRAMAALGVHPCDEAWESIKPTSAAAKPSTPSEKKSWPIMLFVAVVLGGPYLIWKLLKGMSSQKPDASTWMNGDGDHVIARAEFDFQSENDEELSFRAGDRLILAPRDQQPHVRGWLLGTADGKKPGYVPANHVKVLGLRRGRSQAQLPSTNQTTATDESDAWKDIHGNVRSLDGK